MNGHRIAGLFRAGFIILFVFLFGCFLTLRWGGTSVAGDPLVVPDHRRAHYEDHLTLESLYKTPLDQWDPSLLPLVLVPPSKLPYNLENGHREHSHGQAQLIKKLFRGMVGR